LSPNVISEADSESKADLARDEDESDVIDAAEGQVIADVVTGRR
jgi:hypothetical protein